MVTSSAQMRRTFRSDQMRQTGMGLAIAAAVTAAGYGLARFFSESAVTYRRNVHDFDHWLRTRLDSLSASLGTDSEVYDKLSKEIRSAVHYSLSMAHKVEKAKPEKRDLLEIELESRLVQMKLNIHELLDLKLDSQIEALHAFYEELRYWFLPVSVKFQQLVPEVREQELA